MAGACTTDRSRGRDHVADHGRDRQEHHGERRGSPRRTPPRARSHRRPHVAVLVEQPLDADRDALGATRRSRASVRGGAATASLRPSSSSRPRTGRTSRVCVTTQSSHATSRSRSSWRAIQRTAGLKNSTAHAMRSNAHVQSSRRCRCAISCRLKRSTSARSKRASRWSGIRIIPSNKPTATGTATFDDTHSRVSRPPRCVDSSHSAARPLRQRQRQRVALLRERDVPERDAHAEQRAREPQRGDRVTALGSAMRGRSKMRGRAFGPRRYPRGRRRPLRSGRACDAPHVDADDRAGFSFAIRPLARRRSPARGASGAVRRVARARRP